MILTDGTGLALNRNDPTWLEIGSNSCLFPQDYAMSRLSDFELWRITGVEDKLGIPCAVIEGQRGDRNNLCVILQMTIKICRDRIVAMSEPFLNRLHRNIVCKQKAGTRMMQIMKTQMSQSCFGNDIVKTAGHIIR